MKHLLTILSGLLVALLFARCADDDDLSGGIDGLPERGIVIRLSTGELDTRTQLTSTGDYHHVEEVWAVLYKWNGTRDASDPDNLENYDFVSATNLKWDPYDASAYSRPSKGDDQTDEEYDAELDEYLENMQTNYGGEYGNGKVQGREFVLPESGAMTAGTYRVLCIGFDEASKTCYGLQNGSSLTLSGTLAEAYAKLSNKEFGGELFAGWQEFDFEPDNINIVEVELKRRVAGVLCYVTDIPREIAGKGQVKGIRLVLNTQANDKVHLCRKEKPNEDFGTYTGTPASKTVLDWFDLSDFVDNDPTSTGGSETFNDVSFGQSFSDGTTLDEGRLVLSAYLLPVEAPASGYTLSVELLGGDDDITEGDLVDLNTTKVLTTFNATRNLAEEEGLTDEEKEELGRQESCYNILPNYIYHIGNRNGSDIDEPMSLLGQKITVVPQRWTEMEIPVEFPGVPIFCTMELWGNDGIYTTQRYIFDCIGIDDVTPEGIFAGGNSYYPQLKPERLWLRVHPCVLKSKWKLTIYDLEDPSKSTMLYLNLGAQIYDNEFEATSEKDRSEMKQFPVVMTDNLSKFRTSVIQLDTYDLEGTLIYSDTIHVHQYEAIQVDEVAFSRFDLGTQRDYGTGQIVRDDYKYAWGYSSSTLSWEVDSGFANYKRAKGNADSYPNVWGAIFYGGSAVYISAVQRFTMNGNTKEYREEDEIPKVWFLPAFNEMDSFMESARKIEGNYGIKAEEAYWTGSSAAGYTSWDIFLDGKWTGDRVRGDERTEVKHIRQACEIY